MGKGRSPVSELDWMVYNLEMKKYEKREKVRGEKVKKVKQSKNKVINEIKERSVESRKRYYEFE